MNFFLKRILVGLAGLVVAGASAQPTYITGDISFSGGVSLDGPLASATSYTDFFGPYGPDPIVNDGATGAFAGVPGGTAVTFTPFSFNPSPAGTFELWTFDVGLSTYSFEATSVEVHTQNSTFLDVRGEGVARISNTDYAPTPGMWVITDTGAGPVFTFGAVTTVVPEPATGALMLMGGLAAVVVRRWRRD